jgi:hypothetical protein
MSGHAVTEDRGPPGTGAPGAPGAGVPRQALPLITADGLTRAQRTGKSCASCRKYFPRPSVRAGVTPAGEVLMRCPECVVALRLHALIGSVGQYAQEGVSASPNPVP